MPMNKVTFGLSHVHVAFKGVAQVESIEVTHGCSTDGEMTVTVTGAPLAGGTEACVVPVSTESHGSVEKVASAVVDVLNNNADVSANYVASRIGAVIYLAARIVAANDASLAIAFTSGATGVTVGASVNVVAGTTGWGTPEAIPGSVKFTPAPQGSSAIYYADNGPYFFAEANNGYTAELEMALVPQAILARMMGWSVDSNGMIVEIADAKAAEFALLCQVLGDLKNRRLAYYSCKAARAAKEYQTKDDKPAVPSPDKLQVTMLPIDIGGKSVVKGVLELSDTNAAVYNAWFNAVTVPSL